MSVAQQIRSLQTMTHEQLVTFAEENKIQIDPKAEAIDLIVQIGDTLENQQSQELVAGMRLALRTKYPGDPNKEEAAKQFMEAARQGILKNKQKNLTHTLYLRNYQDGKVYSKSRQEGVKISPETLQETLEYIALSGDKALEAAFQEFVADPSAFETPLLVLSWKQDGQKNWKSYVMLYVQPKIGRDSSEVIV